MLHICPTCQGVGHIEATPIVSVSAPPKPIEEKDKPSPNKPNKAHRPAIMNLPYENLSHLRRV